MIYYAGFDVALLTGLGTISMDNGIGQNFSVNLSSGVTSTDQNGDSTTLFFHYDRFTNYQVTSENADAAVTLVKWADEGYAKALQTAMRAAATTASYPSPSNITVACARTTALYTIAHSATFDLAFSVDAGLRFLGFNDIAETGQTSYTGDYAPDYTINPTLSGGSSPGVGDMLNYEPGNIASLGVGDSGRGYGIGRDAGPLYRNWTQQFETKEKTLRLSADTDPTTATHPWTFQNLFEHCRTKYPFIVVQGFGETYDEAFRLRSEGASWSPERAVPGDDAHFHMPFQTLVEGQMVDTS